MPEQSTTDLLAAIIGLCRCEVSVTVNTHRNYYESAESYLSGREATSDAAPDVRAEMIARDTIIEVQAYNATPVGFFYVAHWDLRTALEQMHAALTNDPERV